MPTTNKILKKCEHCGNENYYDVVETLLSRGKPDLDTRPAPPKRYAINYEIERCNKCNFSNIDIERKIDFDEDVLTSEIYNKILKSDYPEIAKSYMLASVIYESVNNYNIAAQLMLNACWVLDDCKKDAKKARIVAAKLFQIEEVSNKDKIVIIDLYRRARELDKAKELISNFKKIVISEELKNIIEFEEMLIDKFDIKSHSLEEIDEYFKEKDLVKIDSIEEIERKLFDPNSNELINLCCECGVVSFEEIALISFKINDEEDDLYVILHSEQFDSENEAVVYQLIGDEKLKDLKLITDDDVIDKVFNEYYRLVKKNNNEE